MTGDAPLTVGCVGPKLLKDFQLTIFHNQYLRIVNGISNSVKREFAKDSVEIYDICQGVSNRGRISRLSDCSNPTLRITQGAQIRRFRQSVYLGHKLRLHQR